WAAVINESLQTAGNHIAGKRTADAVYLDVFRLVVVLAGDKVSLDRSGQRRRRLITDGKNALPRHVVNAVVLDCDRLIGASSVLDPDTVSARGELLIPGRHLVDRACGAGGIENRGK